MGRFEIIPRTYTTWADFEIGISTWNDILRAKWNVKMTNKFVKIYECLILLQYVIRV